MKAVKDIEESSRKSWLASIGIYNESLNKTTDKLDKLYVDGNALLNDLVARGETVEAELKGKLNVAFKGKQMIEEKIAMLKAKLGMNSAGRDIQLERLSAKVDNLIEVVAKLAEQKAQEQAKAKKATPKASSTAKSTAKSTASTQTKTRATGTTAKPTSSETKGRSTSKAGTKKTAAAKPRTRKTTTAAKADTKSTPKSE